MKAVYLALPGLAHRLGHGHDGRAELAALRGLLGEHAWEGDRVVIASGEGVDRALALVGQRVEGLGIAAAVCAPEAWHDGHPLGLEGHRGRVAVGLAREGEVLLTAAVSEVPTGVGLFEAPVALCARVGCVVQVARDYR